MAKIVHTSVTADGLGLGQNPAEVEGLQTARLGAATAQQIESYVAPPNPSKMSAAPQSMANLQGSLFATTVLWSAHPTKSKAVLTPSPLDACPETSTAKQRTRRRGKSSVQSLRIPTFPDHKGRARVRGPHPVSRLRRRFWIRPIAPTNTQARPQQPTLHDSQPHQFHAIPDDINRCNHVNTSPQPRPDQQERRRRQKHRRSPHTENYLASGKKEDNNRRLAEEPPHFPGQPNLIDVCDTFNNNGRSAFSPEMTSRPSLAVQQQRQPTRSLSGGPPMRQSGPPPPQRTLSQSYLPHDLAGDVAPRNGASIRRGGSRLKLELSNDSFGHLASLGDSPTAAIDSSKAFTPSRIMSMADSASDIDMGALSPNNPNRVLPDGMSMLDTPSEPPNTALPMPRRRNRFPVPDPRRKSAPAPPPPLKKDARPRPWAIETPSIAPKYHQRTPDPHAPGVATRGTSTSSRAGSSTTSGAQVGHCADFFPWVGDHPEDHFSHKIITEGHYERQPGQHETSSARNYVFQALKQNRGLQGLSLVYSEVMRHRRDIGQVVAPPSFKPPPRVTLTDTKREVWLRDLANPAITLRRLSRTIPHGIRGRVLLDQCLNKKVPAERAVWLAKCVGANEIRAVKRKGANGALVMGGEAKWIRDWTICVEQFVETSVLLVASSDWSKWRADYAVRLARHLFCAELLDKDHYLEWLVTGVENSNFSKLPFWLVLSQIHWKDILRLRKHGRRLVCDILSHLQTIQAHPERELFQPLEEQLTSTVRSLMMMAPESFVLPSKWPKLRTTVQNILAHDDWPLQTVFRTIDTRNEQLTAGCVRSQPAARSVLIKVLDNALQSSIPEDLSARCLAVNKDIGAVARILLEWATSSQRPGSTKIYIAAYLLSSWASLPGFGITDTILRFLSSTAIQDSLRKEFIFHLVAELVRAELFSMERYIQWLIARGGVKNSTDVDPDGPADTRLLVELPINAISDSLKNIRASMLRRATYPVADQNREIENAIDITKRIMGWGQLAFPGKHVPNMSLQKFTKRLTRAGFQVKVQVAVWLRGAFMDTIKSHQASDQKEGFGSLSDTIFCNVRRILEACEDFRMLGEVIQALVPMTMCADILASCSDTLTMHTQVFAALRQLNPLSDCLMSRLTPIVAEETGPGVRRLLASITSLVACLPGKEDLAVKLGMDLVRYDRSSAIDACSPVSDNNPDGDLQEEGAIERLLASGSSMDKPTLERLFGTLVDTLRPNNGDESMEKFRSSISLLTKLRVFDSEYFDAQMTKWIQTRSKSPGAIQVLRLYPLMVSSGCLSLPLLVTALYGDTSVQDSAATTGARPPLFHQEIVKLLIRPLSERSSTSMSADEQYRFRIAQSLVIKKHPVAVLTAMRLAIGEFAGSPTEGRSNMPLADKILRTCIRSALMELALGDSNVVARVLLNNKQANAAQVAALLETEMDKILLPAKTGLGDVDSETALHISFEEILQLTNELTLPFCQLKLRASLAAESSSLAGGQAGDAGQRLQSQLDLFAGAMDKAIDARNMTWTGLLSCLNPEITQHLKNRAQARFLDMLPSASKEPLGLAPMELDMPAPDMKGCDEMAESLVSVVDAIVRGGSMGRPPQLVSAMADKLMDLWEILTMSPMSAAQVETRHAVQKHWLPHLLTFITLHTATFDTSKASIEVRARAVLALSGIMIELSNSLMGPVDSSATSEPNPSALIQRVFDSALVLVDSLPEDVRAGVGRVILESTSDSRLRYLMSWIPDPGADRHYLVPGVGVTTTGGGSDPRRAALISQLTAAPPESRGKPFAPRRWELLNEPTPNIGENDSSLSLTLFKAFKLQ
ncbi:hypothetical protein M0657_007603 [Pyricularia oryzae]|nr:hypothetical protein M9X92_009317 [Pyricularia oryzae]KAI7918412.1 hypothetical protein M0657_007603 [Pyricularia oryzae]